MVLALVSLYSLSRIADLQETLTLLRGAHRPALGLAVLLLVLSLAAKSLRWRSLMPAAHDLDRTEAYRIFHISMLLNNVLPLRLGDSVRIMSPAIRRNVTAGQAVVVLVAERLVDVTVLAGLALVAAPWIGRLLPKPDLGAPGALSGRGLVVTLGVLLAVLLVVTAVRVLPARYRPSRLLYATVVRMRTVWRDVVLVARIDRRKAALTLGWTAFAWTGTVWLHLLLLEAVGLSGSLSLAIAVTLSTNLSMAIPTTPAHIGIFHAAAAAPLLAAGTSADYAVAYAVLVHAVNTVPSVVIGLVCLLVTGNVLRWRRADAVTDGSA